MNLFEVGARVDRNSNCKGDAFEGIDDYSNPRDKERVAIVAEVCGACCVRPACKRLVALEGRANTPNGDIYGGLIIGSRNSLNAISGEVIPNQQVFIET